MLHIEQLVGGYEKKRIIDNVSFHVDKGEVLGILGPNGSGKSTLLKLISGILPKQQGIITVDGVAMAAYSPKAFARKVAVLPQMHVHAFSHRVFETVSLGRYPHQSGLFSSWTEADEQAVEIAMEQMDITEYRNTPIEALSGGEQQRVFVAQALAQQAPILLLDEPTNHLDIAHQQQLLDTIRKQAIVNGLTVISVFHDINLASLYCDRLLLLNEGRIAAIGTPQEIVKESMIEDVYLANVKTQAHPEWPKPQITLLPQADEEKTHQTVHLKDMEITAEYVLLQTDIPLKTVSSAVHNPGTGWFRTFINRRVAPDYHCDDAKHDMADYIQRQGFQVADTVGMMTAVMTEHAEVEQFHGEFGSVLIMVTAGVGNAVDVAETMTREREQKIGTINTWVIVNGKLSDEAFIQAMITATEAKTKAMQVEAIQDPLTGTIATGTSTDSLLIAATQQGELLPYAGPVTPLGKLVGHGVYTCTLRAIQAYKRAKGWSD